MSDAIPAMANGLSNPTHIYKILTASEWTAFRVAGEFVGSALDRADGFIHLSSEAQLHGTLSAHYADADGNLPDGLMIAKIAVADIAAHLRWEKSRGGDLFPHLYEVAIPMAAVVSTQAATRGD